MQRQKSLPNFANPPLDEVVLGVQFSPISNYSSVHSQGVWELFRRKFPKVQEHQRINPQFETFGGANHAPNFQFHVGGPPQVGNRIWFMSKDESHLIQFQQDRFLTNWRRRPTLIPYPRFESIADSFEHNLQVLISHCASEFLYTPEINQAEITYINIIPVNDFSDADSWFGSLNCGTLNFETLNINFSEVIKNCDGNPYARLLCVIQSVFTGDGKHKAFSLSLTFKGKPSGNNIESAMAFIQTGRQHIVTKFAEITASKAHKIWGKEE